MLDELVADLDELIEVDPGVLADGEVLVGLHRQLERVVAVTTRAWSAGGPTTQANGQVACGFHNRARQRSP